MSKTTQTFQDFREATKELYSNADVFEDLKSTDAEINQQMTLNMKVGDLAKVKEDMTVKDVLLGAYKAIFKALEDLKNKYSNHADTNVRGMIQNYLSRKLPYIKEYLAARASTLLKIKEMLLMPFTEQIDAYNKAFEGVRQSKIDNL